MMELPDVVILPSCPFPSLSWYRASLSEGEVFLDIHENYVKQTERNRIFISDAQGAKFITLPVYRRNLDSRAVSDIVFTEAMNPKVMMKHISTAYKSAPFFEHFEDELREFFEKHGLPGKSLLEFNIASLQWVQEMIGLGKVDGLTKTSSFLSLNNIYGGDYRVKGALSNEVWSFKKYPQTFEDRNGFIDNLSVLDALFHDPNEVENWCLETYIRGQKN